MAKTITLTLKATDINRAIKELQQYKTKLQRLGSELAERLAEQGLQVASIRFANARYDGTNDVQVSVVSTAGGYQILAQGKAVCFIEFGTGVHYNKGAAYPGTKPAGIAEIGHYGKGRGSNDYWRYQGDPGTNGVVMTPDDDPTVTAPYVITQGNPANAPMYYASEEIRSSIESVARRILAT